MLLSYCKAPRRAAQSTSPGPQSTCSLFFSFNVGHCFSLIAEEAKTAAYVVEIAALPKKSTTGALTSLERYVSHSLQKEEGSQEANFKRMLVE